MAPKTNIVKSFARTVIKGKTANPSTPLASLRPFSAQTSLQAQARSGRNSQGEYTENNNRALARYQTRDWKVGDVYAPHDISAAEMRKWRQKRAPTTDAFDALALNPLDLYKVGFALRVL